MRRMRKCSRILLLQRNKRPETGAGMRIRIVGCMREGEDDQTDCGEWHTQHGPASAAVKLLESSECNPQKVSALDAAEILLINCYLNLGFS